MNPVERVRQYLARFTYGIQVNEFEESTGTAEQAARAVAGKRQLNTKSR